MLRNMFAISDARRPLTRATLGTALALAAIGAIGLGSGVAGAAPQQPLPVDDPVPVPAPAELNPATAVNIANTIFGELGSLLNAFFPGSGSSTAPCLRVTRAQCCRGRVLRCRIRPTRHCPIHHRSREVVDLTEREPAQTSASVPSTKT